MTTSTTTITAGEGSREELLAMGTPELGDVVYYYQDADTNAQPSPAVVTGIGLDSLNLNLFDPVSYNLHIRDGVRHVSDFRGRSPESRGDGGWDYTPKARELFALKRQVLALLSDMTGVAAA